jgi:hypothetical protein
MNRWYAAAILAVGLTVAWFTISPLLVAIVCVITVIAFVANNQRR